jgi:hypothetical protein
VDARVSVGGGRTFVKNIFRRRFPLLDTLLKNMIITPKGKDFLLNFREIDFAVNRLKHH